MWLFGSGRKKSNVEVYVSETTPEGFVQVNPVNPTPQPRPTSTNNYESPIPPYPTLPYNIIPQAPSSYVPPKLPQMTRPPANPLDSIPFRFAKELQQGNNITDYFNLTKSTIDRIKENLETNVYNYDFSLEKSVLQEVTSSVSST